MGHLAVTELVLHGIHQPLVVDRVALQPLEAQAELVVEGAGYFDGDLHFLLLAVVFVCEGCVNLHKVWLYLRVVLLTLNVEVQLVSLLGKRKLLLLQEGQQCREEEIFAFVDHQVCGIDVTFHWKFVSHTFQSLVNGQEVTHIGILVPLISGTEDCIASLRLFELLLFSLPFQLKLHLLLS